MKRLFGSLALLLCTLALAACAQFGLQAPESTQDRLQYAKAVLTGVNNTIADNVGVSLPVADAMAYREQTREARRDLDLAEQMLDGARPGGETQALTLIRTTLVVLQGISAEMKKRYPAIKVAPVPAPA